MRFVHDFAPVVVPVCEYRYEVWSAPAGIGRPVMICTHAAAARDAQAAKFLEMFG